MSASKTTASEFHSGLRVSARSACYWRGPAALLVACCAIALATGRGIAQVSPALKPGARREALPNFDRRSPTVPASAGVAGLAALDDAAVANLRRSVPSVRVDRDAFVGAPSFVRTPDRFLAGASAARGSVGQGQPGGDAAAIVGNFIDANQGLFGHNSSMLTQARVRRDFVTRHNGLRTVIWEQRLDDIAVFEATLHAHLTARGELVNVASRFIADPTRASQRSTAARAGLTTAPVITARDAIAIAGRNVGEQVSAGQVTPIDVPAGAERRQRFRTTVLTDAEARYTWLPIDASTLRLCWEVICSSRSRGEMFRVVIDAETGEPLVRHGLTEFISDASYRVFTSDSPSPFSPGHPTPLTTQPPLVSRTLVTTPALNTNASPNGWIDDGVMETRGNNVDAHTDTNADDSPDLPRPQATGAGRVFDPALDLTQAPSSYREAAVVNLFYWCNFMHDKLYELGFDEASGNFQNSNFGRGGAGNDAVQADAQDGSGTNNANFSTPPDGSPGRMQMYVFDYPTPDRDGDFDAEIILHEYTHGLSNRLVGGGVGMSALASRGMGEGWSDFYGLALLSEPTDSLNGNYAAGGYATYQLAGLTSNYYFGIRRYPYSTDTSKNPLTFRDIDPTQASSHTGIPRSPIIGSDPSEVHNSGEVWCVTLWDVRANLVARHGFAVGSQLTLQLVTDGMKLSPANPNFLQARDAILQADLVNNGGANRGEIWAAFAKRGMGASATAPNSSTTIGVVESFDLPDDLGVGPSDTFSPSGTVGGPFTPVSRTYTLANSGSASLSWTAASNVAWLNLSSAGGTLAPGANTTVIVSLNSGAAGLSVGSYSATLTFRNATSGISQTRTVQLEVQPFTVAILTENFESGALDPARWTVSGTGNYRTQIATSNAPHGGTRHLTMDQALDSGLYARNEATLTVNLAGQRDVILKFWAKVFDDDPDGPPASPFTGGADFDGVAISADGTNWYEVQPLRSPFISNAWTQFTVDLDAAIAAHGLSYNSNFKIRFNQYDNYAIPVDGIALDDILIARVYANQLTLTVAATVNENASPISATITATPVPTSALSVALSSSLPGSLSVPASVTIPSGQASAIFTVTPLDDALLNGTRTVTLTGSAATWSNASATIGLQDNETAVLGVTLPSSITEGTASATGTVTISAAPAAAVIVQLASSDAASLQIPTAVTIPAGQTSATFGALAVDDNKINGTRSVAVTASVANWTSGQASTSVLDNESTALALTVASTMREGDTGVTGTIRIGGTLTSNLILSLGSDDPTELTVPANVTIAAGQTSATFGITVVDDTLADGPQTVHVNATASGFTSASATVTVADNDAHHFAVSAIGSTQVRGAPINLTVTAQDVSNATITNYNSAITLSATSGGSGVTITPTTASGFVNGVWTGNVTIGTFATNVVITASDSGGHTGSSNAFDVGTGPLHHFAWSGLTPPQIVDTPFNVSLTAQDIGNNPVPFAGAVDLGVQLTGTAEVLSWIKYSDTSSSGEYENTKRAISSFFTGYHETSTTVTDAAALQAALVGKHVFLVPEQEMTGTGTMGTLGTAWASVLTSFVNGGGTVIVCSDHSDEHMLLVNSGLVTATKTVESYSLLLTKSANTPLNAGVVTPFTGYWISQYSGINGDVSLEAAAGAAPVVFSRSVGAGRAIMIGTDYYTIGTGMDRIIANAVSTALSNGGAIVPIRPASAAVVNGTWTGGISIPITGSGLRLAATPAGGTTTTSTAFDVIAALPPPSGGATIFTEDFESGAFSSAWALTGTGNFRTQIITAWGPHGGTHHMTMDQALDSGVYARNEATFTLNLAGRSGVVLSFWATQFGDEYDGPPTSPFPSAGADFDGVAISADGGVNWYEVQPFNTLNFGVYSQFTINLDAALATRGLSYSSNFKIRFNQYDNFALGTDGIGIDDIVVTGNPLGTAFSLNVPAQGTEGSSLPGSIVLPAAVASNVTFALSSSAPAKVVVPSAVTVMSGQASANFTISLPDDTLLDGSRAVLITASASGFQPTTGNLTVLDNDTATLTLTVPPTATEGDGTIQGTLRLSATPAGNITVNLGSTVVGAAMVPASISIPPGQTTTNFPITIVDDTSIDGTQTTTISASLPGGTPVTATLAVADNDTARLSLSLVSNITEGTTTTGVIGISGTLTSNLTISLASSAPSRLTVPATVLIPAGSTSASFTMTAVENSATDGAQSVNIDASASGFAGASRAVTVLDNDVHHFGFSSIATQQSNVPFPVTVTAYDVGDIVVSTFNGTASLTAASSGSIPVNPSSTTPFLSGVWTGNVSVGQSAANVRLTATAGGATGTSGAFNVTASPMIDVTPPTVSVTVPLTTTATRNATLSNTGGGNLSWSISNPTSILGGVATGPVFTSTSVVQKDKADVSGARGKQVYSAARAPGDARTDGTRSNASGLVAPVLGRSLADVLASLNNNNNAVRAAIPNRYAFSEGVVGNAIGDGGNDMYDGGNYLGASITPGSWLNYSDNTIIASPLLLGSGGQYFTRKYEGLFVFAADVSGLSYFEITGNLGADGYGSTDTAVLTVTSNGTTYRGFVKRVYNAYDPSVNHLIIVPENSSVTHEASTNTNDDYHRVTNLAGVTRIYYLLYAGASGAYIDNTATQAIMAAFLDATATPDWVNFTPASGTIASGASTNVTLTLGSTNLAAGTYARSLQISSNDPLHTTVAFPVNLTVLSAPSLAVSPATGFSPAGLRGGPFTPATQVYTLTNPGDAPIGWIATKAAAWLDVSPTSGTLAAGANTTVTVSLNGAAAALATGSYADSLAFTNTTNGYGNTTRAVTVTVSPVGELSVTPSNPIAFDGPVGGPFAPAGASWTLTNSGDAPLAWTATKTQPWLALSGTGGTLAPGASATVSASITSAATSLPIAVHHDPVLLANSTTGRGTVARLADLTVRPLPPVLAAEPSFTGGASNTISWSALSVASEYEVQAANNAGFTTPISSGWITGTSYTFSPLTHGQTWYFRVRARQSLPAETGVWKQTTQGDFNLGTKSNVETVTPGDVVLGYSPSGPIAGRVINASFETGNVYDEYGPIDGWTRQNSTSQMAGIVNNFPTIPMPTAGAKYLELFSYDRASLTAGSYVRMTQTVDFTASSTLVFDALLTSWSTWTGVAKAEVRIDGTSVWSRSVAGYYGSETISVSSYTGPHTLEIREELVTGGTHDSQWALFDNVRLNGIGAYAAAGTLISPLIAPLPLASWGVVQFNRDTSAAGTALTVDVLDATGNLLATDIASGTNLGSISAIASQPALKFRANLSTWQTANTPRLLDWGIAYTSAVSYIIETPWSSPVSSLQDAAAPVVVVTSPTTTTSSAYTLSGTANDNVSGVSSLTINSASASTGNGFANWTSAVALTPGNNSFTLVAIDGAVPANVALSTYSVFYNPPGSPVITGHPQLVTANAGGPVSFTVSASGSAPLAYQWWKGSTLITAATNATLSLANVQPTDSGSYSAVVSNSLGSVTSNPAVLTVISPPKITTHPQPATVAVGQGFTFSVGVSGTAPFNYQWRKNGGDIPGATNATYASPSAVSGDAGSYFIVVTNSGGTATSNPAALTVISAGAAASHSVLGGGYVAGDVVAIDNTLVYAGAASGVTWQVVLPAGWSFASSTGSNGDTRPIAGTTGTIQWTWNTVPSNPVRFSYKLNIPSGTTGVKTLAAIVDVVQSGSTQHLLADPDPLSVAPVATHSADADQDYCISLVELTRVIELYNTRNASARTGCYAVQSGSEDGFAPDPSRAATATVSLSHYHSSDTNRDGKISLFELTRAIELYNYRSGTTRTGQYHVQAGTEDGFAPGS